MASQRRAPTKRPPRPAAKKPPPPGLSDGVDAAEVTKPKTRKTTTPSSNAKSAPAGGRGAAGGAGAPRAKAASPEGADALASSSSGASKSSSAPAKGGSAGASPRPGSGGPNYRPPTGATRSAARRPPPPPRRKKRNITTKTIVAIVALPLVASLVIFFALAVNGSSTGTPAINATLSGPEQVAVPSGPVLGSVLSARYPQTIDGIKCEASEQVVYHIHAHLTIFVNGQPRVIPYGIGIDPPLQYTTSNGTFVNGGICFYWLHTHAADGIMHIESPTQTTYNLGQFFDVWGQPLNGSQVGAVKGPMKVFVDGKPYTGDPRLIPLQTHTQVQLDVGTPAPAPVNITFPSGL